LPHAILLSIALVATPGARVDPLFVLARSKNANVVEYVARVATDGLLDEKQPFEAHWVLKAEDGRVEPLSYLEELLAYGFVWKARVPRQEFSLTMHAFPERALEVVPHGDGYQVVTSIGGVPSRLARIFVTSEDTAVGLPKVSSVELLGVSLVDGAPTHEELVRPKKEPKRQARRDDSF